MSRFRMGWLPIAMLSAAIFAPAAAQPYMPELPEGAVYDGADIIPKDAEQAMDARLRAYNRRTGRQVVVSTVPSLGGQTVREYAWNLFDAPWNLGDEGLLLLVAPNDRAVGMVEGRSLRETFPSELKNQIIRETITPRFRDGAVAAGISAGLDEVIAQLERSEAERAAAATEAGVWREPSGPGPMRGSARTLQHGFNLFWVLFYTAVIMFFWYLVGRWWRGRL